MNKQRYCYDSFEPPTAHSLRAVLRKYERGELKMPSTFLLKIFMFGLDNWTDGIYWSVDSKEKTDKKEK